MSRCLAERGVDHVVLERGMVANSWRTERWNSLRLLTPNWQSRLPGYGYEGDDPDGYRTMPEVIAFLDRYAKVISAPVEVDTTVTSVRASDGDYLVETNRDAWQCRTVVLATGACNVARIPEAAEGLGPALATFTPMTYRHPDQLPAGGVLVVGASATGTQLADEIHRSGRPVTIAVGEHIRAPRVYRGRDIQWWMDAAGVLDERYDQVDDINRARGVPSLQLTGSTDRATLDLNALTAMGVRMVGRFVGMRDGKAQFSGSLRNQCMLSDLKMNRLLNAIDEWATANGLDDEVEPLEPPAAHRGAGVAASHPGSGRRRHSLDRMGDRIQPRSFVAARPRARSQGPDTSRRRRGRGAGPVPDGHAIPATAQVGADRWRRRRCARSQRPPCALP